MGVLGGSVDIVKTLIDDGADVNCCSEVLEASLLKAIKTGHYEMVQLLITNKAHVNLLVLFSHFRLKNQLRLLQTIKSYVLLTSLNLKYDLNQTAPHEAVRHNALEKLRSKLDQKI